MNYLSDNFLEKYKHKTPPFGGNGLGEFIALRTYCRLLLDEKRREKWWEVVARVVEYNMKLYSGHVSGETLCREAEELYDAIFNMRIFPSGRSLWIGGTKAVEKFPSAAFNCAGTVINNLKAFEDLFHLLMVGAGVGYRVLPSDVEKLPRFYKNIKLVHESYIPVAKIDRLENTVYMNYQNGTYDIIIGDSKLGWTTALKIFLELLSNPDTLQISINYNSVRPKGELLKTFGGRAAGHDSIMQMLAGIHTIISENPNIMLRPIDVMDICDTIAYYVVVGGVRRSSTLCLFDITDVDIRDAKIGLWEKGHKNYGKFWRGMSNNSIFFEQKPEFETLTDVFKSIRESGEPGFINAEAARKRRPNFQTINPCLSEDTLVLTKNGHYPIKILVDKSVDIWDGDKWVSIDNFRVTAENQPVWDVILNNGQTITATEYHSFILEDGSRKELKELQIGDILKQHNISVHGNEIIDGAYLKGFLIGDGTFSSHPVLNLYFPKYCCEQRLIDSTKEISPTNQYGNTIQDVSFGNEINNRKLMTGLSARKDELSQFVLEYKNHLPQNFLNWNIRSKLDFIAGFMDADGTASDTKNGFMYQICSISEKLLLDFQLLLRSIGVKCKISLMRDSENKDFGENRGGTYETKKLYRLTISQESSIKLASLVTFSRLTDFSNKKTSYKVKFKETMIVDIQFSHIAEKVYCCTVPETHSFSLSNGVIIGQCAEILLDSNGTCNLCEVNVLAHVINNGIDFDELEKSIKLATRLGLRQTNVTLDIEDWATVQTRDRLLGVSLMGWVDMVEKLDLSEDVQNKVFSFMRETARDEAKAYSFELRVPEPLLVTTSKPGGSLPLLPTVSNGAHKSFAPYFVRRVRITATDPLAKVMYTLNYPTYPENGQGPTVEEFNKLDTLAKFDALHKCDTWVIEFPVRTNAKDLAYNEKATDQLKRYFQYQKYYSDHNTSITVYVGNDEWEDTTKMVYENWDDFIGVSFLPKNTSIYPLLPFEPISHEEYRERLSDILTGDVSELLTEYEEMELGDDLDPNCATGICPAR